MMKLLISHLLVFAIVFQPFAASGALTDFDRQEVSFENILAPWNAGFESGKAQWTASSGTFAAVTSGSNLLAGKGSATWDASATSQTLISKAVTVPNGLKGRNCEASIVVMVPSGTATHVLSAYDGSNTLVSATITSSTTPTKQTVNFPCPTSTIQLRLTSAADEPSITLDSAYLGEARNLGQVNNFTNWTAYTPTVGTTGGSVTASAFYKREGDSARVRIDAIWPTIFTGGNMTFTVPTACSSIDTAKLAGTTGSGVGLVGHGVSYDVGSGQYGGPVFVFSSTSVVLRAWQDDVGASGNHVYESGINTLVPFTWANNDRVTLEFSVPCSGWQAEQAFRPDVMPGSWSGYHDSTCSWARTNTAYGDPATDASCALVERTNRNFGTVSGSNSLPSITFTPTKTGRYWVCAYVSTNAATAGQNGGIRLWDGTTTVAERDYTAKVSAYGETIPVCGIYNAASTAAATLSLQTKIGSGAITIANSASIASAVEWSIFSLDQAIPAPLLVGSVTNTSTGLTRVEAAKLNCDSASSITSQQGDWIASIGNISTNTCLVTFKTGIFSATPHCTFTWAGTSSNQYTFVQPLSASVTIGGINDGGTNPTVIDGQLICVGPR